MCCYCTYFYIHFHSVSSLGKFKPALVPFGCFTCKRLSEIRVVIFYKVYFVPVKSVNIYKHKDPEALFGHPTAAYLFT